MQYIFSAAYMQDLHSPMLEESRQLFDFMRQNRGKWKAGRHWESDWVPSVQTTMSHDHQTTINLTINHL